MTALKAIKHNRSIYLKIFFTILVCLPFCASITIAGSHGKGNGKAHGHHKGSYNTVSAGNVIPGLSKGKIFKHMNKHEGGFTPSAFSGQPKGIKPNIITNGQSDNGCNAVKSNGMKPGLSVPSNGNGMKGASGNIFVNLTGSDVFVKPQTAMGHRGINKSVKLKPVLFCGDSFSQALEIPNPIGAKGPNPVHEGLPSQENGNPGGGNGNGHWGQDNQGNGFGNNWTGNQGRGRGAGMAAGANCPTPEPDPDPNPEPGSDESIFSQAAPLPDELYPEIEGCPLLVEAAAEELGTDRETIQISMGNSLASNPNIQPCRACQTMVNNAAVLKAMDNEALVNALIEVFNELAPPDEPLSEEALAKIAMRLSERPGYFEANPEYALVVEYIDAFVGYIEVLENEMGAPVGNTTEFALEKYGAPISEAGTENPNVAAYIAMQIEGLGD